MRRATIIIVLMFSALIIGCQATQSKVTVGPGTDQPAVTDNAQNVETPARAPASWINLSLEGINM